jgi:hypothetical protein
MNDMNHVPLRGQTETAGLERSVVPLHANPMPTDPAAILAKAQPKDTRGSKGRLVLWGIGGLVAAQLFAPVELKPTVLAGQAVANFSLPTMQASAVTQEQLAHQRMLAERLATMQADYADSRAKCFWGQLLSPEAGEICTQLVDANYVPAINQIRAQLGQ